MRVRSSPDRCLIVGALAFGLLIYCLLPQGLTGIGDDFSYLRSVVETLQHHRPWTDEFLEPWAAGLSILSSGIFLLTGSFLTATHGLQMALGGVGFWACSRLLVNRGLTGIRAMCLAALILTAAPILVEILHFGSLTLYLPCLLLALLAAEERRWGWFAISWFFAFSTRQTAIVWGIIPAIAAWREWHDRGRLTNKYAWFLPAAVVLGGMGAFAGLALCMNRTHAQLMATEPQLIMFCRQLRHLSGLGRPLTKLAIGATVFLLAASLGGWMRHPLQWHCNRATWVRVLLSAVVVLAWVSLIHHWTPRAYGFGGSPAIWYLSAILVLSLYAWVGEGVRALAVPATAAAMIGLGAISIHAVMIPDYLLETAIFGIFAASPRRSLTVNTNNTNDRYKKLDHRVAKAAIVTLGLTNTIWGLSLKMQQDRSFAQLQLVEPALRSGQIHIGEVACPPGPVGLNNWYLTPYALAHVGPGQSAFRGFRPPIAARYRATTFVQEFPWPLRRWPGYETVSHADGETLIAKGTFRCGWFFRGNLALMHTKEVQASSGPAQDPSDFRPAHFPLNDAEWAALIRSRPGISAQTHTALTDDGNPDIKD